MACIIKLIYAYIGVHSDGATAMDWDEERRRLSANWLNTIASGVVTAGTCGSFLAFSLGSNSTATAVKVVGIWIGALVAGLILHMAARAVLPPNERGR